MSSVDKMALIFINSSLTFSLSLFLKSVIAALSFYSNTVTVSRKRPAYSAADLFCFIVNIFIWASSCSLVARK